MLLILRIRNYKSIRQLELHFDFVPARAPKGHAYMERLPFIEDAHKRLVPCMALYGANGCGKSTILEAIQAFVSAAAGRTSSMTLFCPDRYRKDALSTTAIGMSWIDDGRVFDYGMEVASDRVIQEFLSQNDKVIFTVHEGVFESSKGSGLGNVADALRKHCVNIDSGRGRQIRLALPVIARECPKLDAAITSAWLSLQNRFCFLNASTSAADALENLALTFDGTDADRREQAALDLVAKYMKKLDVRVERLEAKHLQQDPRKVTVQTVHRTEDGGEITLDLTDESQGVQRLFVLLAVLLTAVRTGATAVADDLDMHLHAALLPEIIKLFTVRDYNTKKAQLVCAVHNTELLPHLEGSEVAFVSQNGFKGTTVRRMGSFHDWANDHDLRKSYLMGSYDAIPSPFV